ncbi:hypothetical protein ACQY0O_006591 [Thecaphora frezii]
MSAPPPSPPPPPPPTSLPPYLPAPVTSPPTRPRLDGTYDHISLFSLLPLYDRTVRPPPESLSTPPTGDKPKRKHAATYANYVADLVGRVKPPGKRARLLHQQDAERDKGETLVGILNKQEFTRQRIRALDKEALKAFRVEPGEGEVDTSLLEPEEDEAPRKKKKKKRDKDALPAAANANETGTQRT